jgi:hypothetical protein
MPSAGIRLGVDFGTSNTVAVVRWSDGRSRPLLFDGSPAAAVGGLRGAPGRGRHQAGGPVAGAVVTGRDAVHSARLDPARFEPNPKRRIDDGTVLLGDRGAAGRGADRGGVAPGARRVAAHGPASRCPTSR